MSEISVESAWQALHDPTTPGVTLRTIAMNHSDMWVEVANHPNAYPDLLNWMLPLGDASVREAVNTRLGTLVPPGNPSINPTQDWAQAPSAAWSAVVEEPISNTYTRPDQTTRKPSMVVYSLIGLCVLAIIVGAIIIVPRLGTPTIPTVAPAPTSREESTPRPTAPAPTYEEETSIPSAPAPTSRDEATPQPMPTSTPMVEEPSNPPTSDDVTTSTTSTWTGPVMGSVHMRSTASTHGTILSTFPSGTVLVYDCYVSGESVSGDDIWVHVEGTQGYIADWSVNFGGKTLNQLGAPDCSSILTAIAQTTWTFPLLDDVSIRSGPSTDARVNTTAAKGTTQVFDCYLNGTSINGNTVWGHLANGTGYISDYYINAAGNTLEQLGARMC